jgi:hypothetical protein
MAFKFNMNHPAQSIQTLAQINALQTYYITVSFIQTKHIFSCKDPKLIFLKKYGGFGMLTYVLQHKLTQVSKKYFFFK